MPHGATTLDEDVLDTVREDEIASLVDEFRKFGHLGSEEQI